MVIIDPPGIGKIRYIQDLYAMNNVYTNPLIKGSFFSKKSQSSKSSYFK